MQFVARESTGKTDEVSYRKFGESLFSQGEKASVTEQIYELVLMIDGQPAWNYRSVNSGTPFHLQMKEGESVQQAVDRNRGQPSPAGHLQGARIPGYVVHPKYAGPLGTSRIGPGGVE